jgi:hypothetical protein
VDVTLRLQTPAGHQDSSAKLTGHSSSFGLQTNEAPLRLMVDPESNLFRMLYPEEIPATINSVKGATDLVAVFSDTQPAASMGAFELLLASLNQGHQPILLEKEVDVAKIRGKDFFFFGLPRGEALRAYMSARPEGLTLAADHFALPGVFSSDTADCLFAAFSDPQHPGKFVALFLPVAGTDASSISAAARKITHYGKYSYLAFGRGNNQAKGTWAVSRSPLVINFKETP